MDSTGKSHHAGNRLVSCRQRFGVLVPSLARTFLFRNGFADGGRRGLTAADSDRRQDLIREVFTLVNTSFHPVVGGAPGARLFEPL
jgi:hypothetical protein